MTRFAKLQLLFSVLFFAVCVVVLAGRAEAQTFSVLRSFRDSTNGVSPQGLTVSGNTVYATTQTGGSGGSGTVFKVNTDGSAFEVLHSFSGGTDGGKPYAGLILSGNTIFGTTSYGGSSGLGTVFSMSTDGTSFTNLHSFSGSDGQYPHAPLLLQSNQLYGTTYQGGTVNAGTVFALNIDGTDFTNLHSFAAGSNDSLGLYTNSDGAFPQAGLVISGNTLYGAAYSGGTSGNGTVFALNTDGTSFTNLHSFVFTNDGEYPHCGLSLSSNVLYGATYDGKYSGGTSVGGGTVFTLNTDGTRFRILHSFDEIQGMLLSPPYTYANNDGAYLTYLILSGNKLYGTASGGGFWGIGTVFGLNTDGTGFQVLYTFAYIPPSTYGGFWATNIDGGTPNGLVLSGNTLYGTAQDYGVSSNGTVFSISLPIPQLAISRSNENVLLRWPTDFVGYTLQSTTNLASPVWTTNLAAPVIINGQYTVTNPISETQQFFRLTQP